LIFLTSKTTDHDATLSIPSDMDGHQGGDYRLMHAFIESILSNDPSLLCSPESALNSHLVVFASEDARVKDKINHLSW